MGRKNIAGTLGVSLATDVLAGGGQSSAFSGYRYFEFLASGTLTVLNQFVGDVLVVGGGGGGGSQMGGGGGGGEVLIASNVLFTTGSKTVTVGLGGTGTIGTTKGTLSQDSSIAGIGSTITAKRGGMGGTVNVNWGNGASEGESGAAVGNSGGNGRNTTTVQGPGTSTSIAAGTHGAGSTYAAYSGYTGGQSGVGVSNISGGGAGANQNGTSGTSTAIPPDGGDGYQVVGWGPVDYYYGGGGGGMGYGGQGGNGGLGGGGGSPGAVSGGAGGTGGRNLGDSAAVGNSQVGANGGANTGGGGGGGGWQNILGGSGGSGIVVVRYSISQETLPGILSLSDIYQLKL